MNRILVHKALMGAVVVASIAAPFAAFAQPTLTTGVIQNFDAIENLINKAASWLLGILLALAVVFLVYAAFLYLGSGGDEEKVKSAKNYVIYAVIAVIVGVLAKALVGLVGSFIGVGTL